MGLVENRAWGIYTHIFSVFFFICLEIFQKREKKNINNDNNCVTTTKISKCDSFLDQVETAPYLGCTLDQYLQWDVHTNALVPKLSQKLGILKYLKNYVTQSHLIHLYKTLLQPCIDYCITVWGYAADKYLNKVHRIV